MTFLFVSFAAVVLPFGVERFYFRKKFGPFAVLLFVFLFQGAILIGCEALLESGIEMPNLIASISAVIGSVAFLTIGLTPIAAAALSTLFLLLMAVEKLSQKSKEHK